jgi:uncharacterized protein YecT (DUF1311 family)
LHADYLYYNTCTKKFELTNYLRKANQMLPVAEVCAEPTDPLPAENELRARLQTLDQQLNKAYGGIIEKTAKDLLRLLPLR